MLCQFVDATLLPKHSQHGHCWILHVAFVCAPGWMLLQMLGVVAQSLRKHPQNVPSGEERGETDVFAGYSKV